MSDLDQYPLRDNAIYNPHLLSKEELIGLFSARRKLLDDFLEDLASCRPGEVPQHHLLIGQRGMGKTMLLRRLLFAIEDSPELSEIWLPLAFPEEQYNVGGLSDLWLNCLDALGDALDRLGRQEEAQSLDARLEALVDLKEEERARKTLGLLLETAEKLGRRVVLLIDNVDLILERISEQAWALREVLSEQPSILLVGASARALEASFKYEQPFYDFFQVRELGGLSLSETTQLLREYAERWSNEEVLRILDEEPARLRTLHTLTGGNPRTLALLYNILCRGLDGDVRSDLETLLDHCTPLYKARLESLAPQRQRVVHALAVHWHPASAAEVASQLHLEVNAVSSQLTRLVRDGVVEAVPFDPASKTGFQIAERFFNIWYLMRSTRRARRRLIWLVEFLKMFYSQDQLRSHALAHLTKEGIPNSTDRLQHAEYSFALAQSVGEEALQGALETSGLYSLLEDKNLRFQIPELVDLEGGEPGLRSRAVHKRRLEELREKMLASFVPPQDCWTPEEAWRELSRSRLSLEDKEILVSLFGSADPKQLRVYRRNLEAESAFLANLLDSKKLADSLQESLSRGWMMAVSDVEGARTASVLLGEPELESLALALGLETIRDPRSAASELSPAIPSLECPAILAIWAKHAETSAAGRELLEATLRRLTPATERSLLVQVILSTALLRAGRSREAKSCFKRALMLGLEVPFGWLPFVSRAWHDSGEKFEGAGFKILAEQAYEKEAGVLRSAAIDLPEVPTVWRELGVAYKRQQRFGEAEKALQEAVELEPDDAASIGQLADCLFVLERYEEAEWMARKALKVSSKESKAWATLGFSLGFRGDEQEAEGAFLNAIGDSQDLTIKSNELAEVLWSAIALLGMRRGDRPVIEKALCRLVELSPRDVNAHQRLAGFFFEQGRHKEAEEALLRALDFSPRESYLWINLGVVRYHRNRHHASEKAYLRALEYSPEDPRAWKCLSLSYERQRRTKEARESLRRALDLDPEDADSWHRLSIFESAIGALGSAEQAAREAMAFQPDKEEYVSLLAWILFQQSRELGEAEELALKSARSVKSSARDYLILACILGRNSKWSEAISEIERFFLTGSRDLQEGLWPVLLRFFQEAARAGEVENAINLLNRLGKDERWLPLLNALEIAASGDRAQLKRLAPEVRQPTEEILEMLLSGDEEVHLKAAPGRSPGPLE